jgi:HEAT repeat protein
MTRTVEEAVAELSTPDGVLRDQLIALLVSYGTRATAALLPLLDRDDLELRARATRALAYIADPSAADRLAALLDDPVAETRANAAYGLHLLGDPRALEALLATIDDFPNALMYPATQSTGALRTMGAAVLPRVAELLVAPSPETRKRARLVIVQIAQGLPRDEGDVWRARANAAVAQASRP